MPHETVVLLIRSAPLLETQPWGWYLEPSLSGLTPLWRRWSSTHLPFENEFCITGNWPLRRSLFNVGQKPHSPRFESPVRLHGVCTGTRKQDTEIVGEHTKRGSVLYVEY